MIKINVHKELNTVNGPLPLDVDIELPAKKVIAIYGPSGSGKTTLLRTLSGLTKPEKGYIAIEDETWFDASQKINLKPQQRSVGHVFQDYGLFPNMTIFQNIAFGLEKGADEGIVNEFLEKIELTALKNSKPDKLSGGQQQRVALARAIIRKPKLLLLDEPLSALDSQLRLRLQVEIRRMATLNDCSTLFVTHDVTEVFRVADLVIVLKDGQVEKIGTPTEVFIDGQTQSGGMQLPGDVKLFAEVLKREDGILSLLINNRVVQVSVTDKTRHLSAGSKVVVGASLDGRSVDELKLP